MEKKELRHFIKTQITEHSGELSDFSQKICACILNSSEFADSKIIFSYMPLPDEVDVLPLIEAVFSAGKKLALPRVNSADGTMDFYLFNNLEDLKNGTSQGYCGISEPSTSKSLQKINPLQIKEKALILVPGRAFTSKGERLGRGKGFYDSYLAPLCGRDNFCFAGVCFPFQLLPELPLDSHDILVHKIYC